MNVDFIRFKATDSVELRGWSSNLTGDICAIHIHGMSGNGYENYFLDNLREMFVNNNISFLTIDTRGSGIYNSFWMNGKENAWGEGSKLGGSAFEIFEESAFDIQGAINYLKALGKKRFILLGHSLGGSKVVNFLASDKHSEVIAAVLLAPTDMVSWANTDLNNLDYLQKSKKLISEGKGEELVGAECWLDKTPLSAQTYPTICEAGSSVDIYGVKRDESPLGTLEIPMLIAYGDIDIGITKVDGVIGKWLERVNKVKNKNTSISIIEGAQHSFKKHESELANVIEEFIKKQRYDR